MMVTQKGKSASRQVVGTKVKKVSAVTSAPKTAKTAVTATAKIAKETTLVAEPKKAKIPATKNVPSPAAAKKAPATKTAIPKCGPSPTENKPAVKPSPEVRYRMVETAAYFIAEQHGFQGRSDEHWAAAERAIAAKLGQ